MTEEQRSAVEAIVEDRFVMNHNRIYTDGISYGYKVAQSTEMLMLNPLVRVLVRELGAYFVNQDTGEAEYPKYIGEALAPFKKDAE